MDGSTTTGHVGRDRKDNDDVDVAAVGADEIDETREAMPATSKSPRPWWRCLQRNPKPDAKCYCYHDLVDAATVDGWPCAWP